MNTQVNVRKSWGKFTLIERGKAQAREWGFRSSSGYAGKVDWMTK